MLSNTPGHIRELKLEPEVQSLHSLSGLKTQISQHPDSELPPRKGTYYSQDVTSLFPP
jgi:hypothetical protein